MYKNFLHVHMSISIHMYDNVHQYKQVYMYTELWYPHVQLYTYTFDLNINKSKLSDKIIKWKSIILFIFIHWHVKKLWLGVLKLNFSCNDSITQCSKLKHCSTTIFKKVQPHLHDELNPIFKQWFNHPMLCFKHLF